MVEHLALREEYYRDATSCIRALREYVGLGWRVVDVRGRDRGPVTVVFARSIEAGERAPEPR